MPTVQDAKDFNDEHIRQKTEALSISTDEVADAIDNVANLIPQPDEGAVAFADADKNLVGDASRFFWDNTAKRLGVGTNEPLSPLHVVGEFRVTAAAGTNDGNPVIITHPVNAGFSRFIRIDQPNCRIILGNGNGDISGDSGLRRVQQSGELQLIAANNINGSSETVTGFLTFYAGSAGVKARIDEFGFAGAFKSKNGTPTATEVPAGFFAIIKNTADDTYSVWVNDGGTLIEVIGGGGGGVSIDESFHTLTDGATITIDYDIGRNFKLPSIAGNRTIAVANVVEGREIKIKVPQDITGGRTLTMPAGTKIPHSQATGLTFNLSAGGSQVDYIVMWHDGDNLCASALFNLHS